MSAHSGWLEGIANAQELRQRILEKAQHTSGLGDEPEVLQTKPLPAAPFSNEQISLLQEIHSLTTRWKSIATPPHDLR